MSREELATELMKFVAGGPKSLIERKYIKS